MARKVETTVTLTDDLDGSKADQTVTFAYDGNTYEIDLSKKNATAFLKALKPYLDAGRKVKATRTRRSASAGGKRTDLAAVRTWANEVGYEVSDRGRIPAHVLKDYDEKH
jgi:hypothetical protein